MNNINKSEEEKLIEIIKKPFLLLAFLSDEAQAKQIKDKFMQQAPEEMQQILQDMPIIDIIKTMPKESLEIYLSDGIKQIDELPGTIIDQAAISFLKKEYASIGMDLNKMQTNYILYSGMQMFVISLVSMLAGIFTIYISTLVASKLSKFLREKIFSKVLGFAAAEFKQFSTASLITRNTNDVQQIQNLIPMFFRIVIYAPIIGIGGVIKVWGATNNSMTWVIGLAVAIISFVVSILFVFAMPKFNKMQSLIDKVNLVSREILTGLPVIRAFNKEKYEEERFNKANIELNDVYLFLNKVMSIMMPLMFFIMNMVTVLIIWVGSHNISSGIMQVGDLLAFIQYTLQIIMAFLMISMISIMLPRAGVSAKRIIEVLETEEQITDRL